uniref:Uncharacterized protein LOC8264305 isoform X2 n=1 Tax=Rhizophora mucronata TaxID=61149 RepID=A0A2P2LAG4_RHIMU
METYMACELNTILISSRRTYAICKFNDLEKENNIRIPLLWQIHPTNFCSQLK